MGVIYYLGEEHFEGVQSLALFAVEFLDFNVNFDVFDGVIFTSKNAVKALAPFAEELKKKAIYSIGAKTTKALQELQLVPLYQSQNSYGNTFALELLKLLAGKNILYPKATIVASSLIEILKNENIKITPLDVYETKCKKNYSKIKNNSAIIFSSPSSVRCFEQSFDYNQTCTYIAIGNTTAKAIKNGVEYIVSDKQDIEHCIELANTMLVKQANG